MKKLRLEEELESKNWSPGRWVLAFLALMGLTYGAIRFLEWAMK